MLRLPRGLLPLLRVLLGRLGVLHDMPSGPAGTGVKGQAMPMQPNLVRGLQ
jgi:hypothetical protein